MVLSPSRASPEEPDLRAASAEAERAVGEAVGRAVAGCGRAAPAPSPGKNPGETVSQWVEWWVDAPAPYDSLSCEVLLLLTGEGPEVSGKVAAWKYLGHGCSDDEALWASAPLVVASPAAAAEVRRVTAELVRQLARLELRSYVADKTAGPGAQGRGGR